MAVAKSEEGSFASAMSTLYHFVRMCKCEKTCVCLRVRARGRALTSVRFRYVQKYASCSWEWGVVCARETPHLTPMNMIGNNCVWVSLSSFLDFSQNFQYWNTFSVSHWYPALQQYTFKTKFIKLSVDQVRTQNYPPSLSSLSLLLLLCQSVTEISLLLLSL